MTILAPTLPKEHGILQFGRGLPSLHNYEFSFSYRWMGVDKKFFESKIDFLK